MTLDDAPDVLTVQEAARLARVGRNGMYAAISRGEIYSARIGRTIRIPKAALRAFLGIDLVAAGNVMTSSGPDLDGAPRSIAPGTRPAPRVTSSGARGAGPGDP